MGFNDEKLEAIYAHDWMPAFRSLKLVWTQPTANCRLYIATTQ